MNKVFLAAGILFSLPFMAFAAGARDGIAGEAAAGEKIAGDGTGNEAFLVPLQERDSVLIADQLEYGFELEGMKAGTDLMLPDYSEGFCEGVEVVSPWRLDTVRVVKGKKKSPEVMDVRGSVTITSFDEGEYELPPVYVVRISPEGIVDTLEFASKKLSVKTMPVDTATFEMHDIKGQIRYPIEFREVLPYIVGVLLLAAVILAAVYFTRRYFGQKKGSAAGKEPAHITALRKLDGFRGEKYWAPEKQKAFYSGVTDTLREYLSARYGVAAMEKTTKEIFDELKDKDVPEELYGELKELFERSDYVKFAKYVAGNDENAKVVPVAVRFVTMTYQEILDSETKENREG